MGQSTADILASLDVAASIDPVIVSADPEVRRTSTSAFQVRRPPGAAGAFRFVIDTTNKRFGWSTIDGAFTPGVMWDGETQGGDFFMRATVYSSGLDDEVEWVARKAHGTKAAPLALGAGSCILEWESNGYNGASFTGERANYAHRTTEAWTGIANGIEHVWRTTSNGSTSPFDALLLENDGTLDIVAGGLEIGNVDVFESDRDLAVNLIPNADSSLDVGSIARRFDQIIGNHHDVYAGVGDTEPTARLSGSQLVLGPGGAVAPDLRYRRAGTSLGIFDDDGSTTRPWIIDGANVRVGYSSIDNVFAPAFSWHSEGSASLDVVFDVYGTAGENFMLIGRKAQGTKGAPAALSDDSDMLEFVGRGYDGVSFSGDQAAMLLEADGAWTAISHGTKWTVKTTPPGSLVIADAFEVRGAGAVNIVIAELEIGGVDVFEADRDLAINLIPNATGTLDIGSTTRKFDQVFANQIVYQRHLLYADQLDNPVTANWAVNALAPASADSLNSGLTVRRFDDTTEEGVGFIFTVPVDATEVVLNFKSRAQTAPGVAEGVVPRLYLREIPDNGAVGAWSAGLDLTAISIPTNTNFQYDSQVIAVGTLGITAGRLYQFELTRNPAAGGDTLVGDWNLLELGVIFR